MNLLHGLRPRPCWGLLAACGLLGAAQAQTPPPFGIGDALKAVQPPPAPVTRPVPELTEAPPPAISLAGGDRLMVQSFRFEGADFLPEAGLQAAVSGYAGRALSLSEMEAAAAQVTVWCRQQGYLLARAYVPQQDARAGSLLIRVLAGQAGVLAWRNQSLVQEPVLAARFAPVLAAPALHRAELERAMLLVGDLPGASLPQVTVSPGAGTGLTDLLIELPPGRAWSGQVMADNTGSRFTGRHRLSGQLAWHSPLGLGDQLALQALDSTAGGLVNGRLAYSAPLGSQGLRAELAASRTTYALGSDYADLGATGTARSLEASFSFPVLRQRDRSVQLSLNVADKHLRDDIATDASSLPKTALTASLGLQMDAWGALWGTPGHAGLALSVTQGQLDITNAQQARANLAGDHTVGDFSHLRLQVAGDADLPRAWTGHAGLNLQRVLRSKRLDSSEQMSISGANAVMAYSESVSGDNAWLLNLSLRHPLPTLGVWQSQGSVFADHGRVFNAPDATDASAAGTQLSDVGLGLAGQGWGLQASLQWAHALGTRPASAGVGSRNRWLAQLAWGF
jgi:hemolysin activation/secretion protein